MMLKKIIKKQIRFFFKRFDTLFFDFINKVDLHETRLFHILVLPKSKQKKESILHSLEIDFSDKILQNHLPLYIDVLNLLPKNEKIRILDIGSRGDTVAGKWSLLKNYTEFHCFEINEKSNEPVLSTDSVHLYNNLISGQEGYRKFYIRENPFACSIHDFEMDYYKRIKNFRYKGDGSVMPGLQIKEEKSVPSTTVEKWAESNNISDVDFMKVDVEGAELEVLASSSDILNKTLGVLIEVDFSDRVKVNNDFATTHQLMKNKNLYLSDFTDLMRLGRLTSTKSVTQFKNNGEYSHGSLTGANAIYLADPLHHNNKRLLSDVKTLKLAVINGVQGLFENSFELLKHLEKNSEDQMIRDKLTSLRKKHNY